MTHDPYPPGILGEMLRATDRIKFAEIIRNEAKRTILCRPDQAARLRWHIDQAGLAGVLTVVEWALAPDGQMYVVDQQAIEAGIRESIARIDMSDF